MVQARILARQYKELSEKEMKKWEKKAEADKLRYQREMADYVPAEDPTGGGGGKTKKSKRNTDPNAPKRNSKFFSGRKPLLLFCVASYTMTLSISASQCRPTFCTLSTFVQPSRRKTPKQALVTLLVSSRNASRAFPRKNGRSGTKRRPKIRSDTRPRWKSTERNNRGHRNKCLDLIRM